MLSKNKIKFVHSLEQKKARRETACFVAEGNKLVNDTIRSFDCRLLVATASWLEEHPGLRAEEIIEVSSEEIKKVSLQKTPQDVIAVYRIREFGRMSLYCFRYGTRSGKYGDNYPFGRLVWY